ncbi:hypothetical protein AB0B66_10660 [Catellatospora sp. NPDC049111]|uniref:hypothetical protein n=1 Tax=Catellatospora sp. NPDC049111 TaxID=3155271 RepID=UPI0033F781EB
MAWHFMQAEITPPAATSMIGQGSMPRDQAHTEVQSLLDRLPETAETAAAWRWEAKNHTIYLGPFIRALFEHPENEDPQVGAQAWLDDFFRSVRATGAQIEVAWEPR